MAHVGEAAEGVHDAPDRSEQADVGTRGAHRRQKRQMGGEPLLLTIQRHPHAALHALHDGVHLRAGLIREAHEFLKARHKNGLNARQVILPLQFRIEFAQVNAGPKVVLKVIDLVGHPAQEEPALKDHHPRDDRCQRQQRHDQLHQQAGIGHQLEYGNLFGHVRCLLNRGRPGARRRSHPAPSSQSGGRRWPLPPGPAACASHNPAVSGTVQ